MDYHLWWEKANVWSSKPLKRVLGLELKGWGRNLLSKASKVMMIQVVAQAIPLYCFKLFSNLLHDINMLILSYGVIQVVNKKFIEKDGIACVYRNWMEVWDSKT